MKNTSLHNWTLMALSILAAGTLAAGADEATATMKPEKTCTAIIKSVDARNRVVGVKRFLGEKRFNLGEPCVFSFVDKNDKGIDGVRIGQKVTVAYRDANGVLVASRLTQEALRYTGAVKALDTANGTLLVGGRTFRIANGCAVVLRNERVGMLTDVEPGHFVTVWYEEPEGGRVARRIAQTSRSFIGSLTAIDLSERTVKAKSALDSKTFHLADNCSILVNGETAQMKDLKPEDKIEFSYDEINGVNVATRVAPVHNRHSAKP